MLNTFSKTGDFQNILPNYLIRQRPLEKSFPAKKNRLHFYARSISSILPGVNYMKKAPLIPLFYFLVLTGFGQVTGLIRNQATGQPVPYASILLENEDQGTTAGPDGHFTLHAAPSEKKNLVI